jgi:probable HAF family extracellular repeat protein
MKSLEIIDADIGKLAVVGVLLATVFGTAAPALAKKGGGGGPGGGDPPSYHQIDLLGGVWGFAFAINDLGQIALTLNNPINQAHLLTPEDTDYDGEPDTWFKDVDGDGINDLAESLGSLGGSSVAYDLNEQGQVVGRASNPTYGYRAFIWQNGVMSDLGVLPGGGDSRAYGINESGMVVGESAGHAFVIVPIDIDEPPDDIPDIWNQDINPQDGANDLMFDLGTLGGSSSAAYDISDYGEIVGEADTASGDRHPFIFDLNSGNPMMIDLGTFGGSEGRAEAISVSGQTTGWAMNPDGEGRAFLITPVDFDGNGQLDWWVDGDGDGINDLMADLGVPRGKGKESFGYALNDSEQVVGLAFAQAKFHTQPYRDAVIWENGEWDSLKTASDGSGEMEYAYAINNSGLIILGTLTGDAHLLVPIP